MKQLLLILCLFSMSAHADLTETKLTWYICKSEVDAYSCSKNCETTEEMRTSFLVDKNNKKIFQKFYVDRKLGTSTTHDECSIFDSHNWECVYSGYNSANGAWRIEKKMNNGIYISASTNGNPKGSAFECAK